MALTLIRIRSWLADTAPRGRDDRGASLVEYALLLALIAIVCVAALGVMGGSVNDGIQSGADSFP
jgi:Flp pilus assembly pilin Flp